MFVQKGVSSRLKPKAEWRDLFTNGLIHYDPTCGGWQPLSGQSERSGWLSSPSKRCSHFLADLGLSPSTSFAVLIQWLPPDRGSVAFRWDCCESLNWLFCFLLAALLASQTRLASRITAPLTAETVYAVVLAALLIGLGLVYQTRDSSESAIRHSLRFQSS